MYTIGRLAKRARVKADCIRFYERQGLVSPANKTPAGYRLYTDATLRRIIFIKHAQRCGLSLAEILELLQLHAKAPDARAAALRRVALKKRELDITIATLHALSAALASVLAPSSEPRSALATSSDSESPLLDALEACLNKEAGIVVSAVGYAGNAKPQAISRVYR
jgi:MerR family Zn(II)-responsive transcriptional regulator of zntA